MSGVKDLIAKLDAAKLQAEAEFRAREKAALEERARLDKEADELRQRKLRDEEAKRLAAIEEERRRWKVDEAEAAKEVQEKKKKLIEMANGPKKIPHVFIQQIPTIVIDMGSSTMKVGFAGEDAPRWVISSVIGRIKNAHVMDLKKHSHINQDVYVGDQSYAYDVLDIKRVIVRGVVQNWDDFQLLLEHIFFNEIKLTKEALKDHPILLSEPPLNPKANREMIAKILFTRFNVPALYVANTSALALFSAARVTGVVVEAGYGVCSSVAVYDGEVISRSFRRLNIGGFDLDEYLMRLMNLRGYRFNTLKKFDNFIVRDIKERLCFVSPDIEIEEKRKEGSQVKSMWVRGNVIDAKYNIRDFGNELLPGFETKTLPDEIIIASERYQCMEALFQPHLIGQDSVIGGLHNMVIETMKSVPIDLIREMYGNIILAGGTTLSEGFANRLRTSLNAVVPRSCEVNIVEGINRHLAAWQGGSILAKASLFNMAWISRAEYEKYGSEIIHAPQ